MLTLLGISQGQFRRQLFVTELEKMGHTFENYHNQPGVAVRVGLKVQRLDRILDPVVITKFCEEPPKAPFDLGCVASTYTYLAIALFQLR